MTLTRMFRLLKAYCNESSVNPSSSKFSRWPLYYYHHHLTLRGHSFTLALCTVLKRVLNQSYDNCSFLLVSTAQNDLQTDAVLPFYQSGSQYYWMSDRQAFMSKAALGSRHTQGYIASVSHTGRSKPGLSGGGDRAGTGKILLQGNNNCLLYENNR